MNKLLVTFLSCLIYINSSFALSNNDIPDEFSVTEHWISLTTSYDIETPTRKIGTLYRKFFSFLLTYEFFDPFDNKLAIARSRFFSFTAHFDVYDPNENLLGMAEEKTFTFFPTFDIYASDASTKLAKAKMNFWGTTFTIYDPVSNQEMAVMHRSFLRLKNDWDIRITNRSLFMQKNIDPRVLMTVIAFQGDRENWKAQESNINKNKNKKIKPVSSLAEQVSDVTPQQLNMLLEKIDTISKNEGLDSVKKPDQNALETIANELENNFNSTQSNDDSTETSQEKISSFTDYCLNLVQSSSVPDSKKKAIIYLLKMRLESEVK